MPKDKEIKIKIVGDARDAEQALEGIARRGKALGTALKVGIGAAVAGMAGFTALMKSGVEAAAQEEKAITMLSDAMRQHGTYSDEALKSLKNFAAEQQKLTTFADDATLAAMHQLQTFGMNTETMKAATKAAQDLAAAKGIDLNTAVQLVGKAYAGNTASLSRYGIVLDQAKLQAGGFTYVLEELNARFGGAAAAAADTYTGRVEQLKNVLGDLKETIGYAVLPSLKSMAEGLSATFAQLGDSGALQKLLEPLGEAFGRLAPLLGDALVSVVDMITRSGILDSFTNLAASVLEVFAPLLQQLGPPIAGILAALGSIASELFSAIAPVIAAMAPVLENIVTGVSDFLQEAAPYLGKIASQLGEILTKILQKMEPHLDRILDAVFEIIESLLPVLPALLDLLVPILDATLSLIDPLAAVVGWAAEIAAVITGALGGALTWLAGAIQDLGSVWGAVWNGVKAVFEGAWRGIIAFKDSVIMPVVDFFGKIWDGLAALWSRAFATLKKIVKPVAIGFLEVARAFAKAYDYTLNFGADTAPMVDAAIAKVRAWHQGGPISRRRGEVFLPLGLFKGGEWVIREQAVEAIGERNMALINQGRLPPSGGDVIININFSGPVISDDRSWEEMARKLQYRYAPRIARAVGVSS